jgi:hypothetical protein
VPQRARPCACEGFLRRPVWPCGDAFRRTLLNPFRARLLPARRSPCFAYESGNGKDRKSRFSKTKLGSRRSRANSGDVGAALQSGLRKAGFSEGVTRHFATSPGDQTTSDPAPWSESDRYDTQWLPSLHCTKYRGQPGNKEQRASIQTKAQNLRAGCAWRIAR